MPTVEITRPTTVRELLLDERGEAEVAVALTAQLPELLSRERHLPKAAYRLLNSRITTLAVEFLDTDVTGVILSGLGAARELVRAAEDTLAHPADDVVVHLTEPYRIEAEQKPYIDVLVDELPAGRVTFDLNVSIELFETSVAVRNGAMTAVDCTVGALVITFTVDGWAQPLVTRRVSLPIRLTLRPPVTIPVGPSVPVPRLPSPPPATRGRATLTNLEEQPRSTPDDVTTS